MSAFLCISVGSDPETARPILASTDPDVVEGAVRAILGKLAPQASAAAPNPSRSRRVARPGARAPLHLSGAVPPGA